MTGNRLYRNLLAAAALVLAALPALAEELGTVFVDTQLRSTPGFSGKTVASVGRDSRVEVLERRGIWMQVRLADRPSTSGWLRRFDVRLDSKAVTASSSSGSSSGLGHMLGGLFGGGRSDPGATSTIGIRGLDAADLTASHPDPAQLQKLHTLASSKRDAQAAAKAAGLQARQVDYLVQSKSGGLNKLLDW